MNISKVILKDFKGVKNASYDLKDITTITGQNGSGKTTILDAIYWVLFNCDYSLSKPTVAPIGNELAETEVKLIIDGVTFCKSQTRTAKANGYSCKNAFSIDEVPMTEKRYNEALSEAGINKEQFMALSHPDYFFKNTTDGRREILIQLSKSHSDVEVATELEFEDLAKELETVSASDIKAKATAKKKAIEKEVGKDFAIVNAKLEVLGELKAEFSAKKVASKTIAYIDEKVSEISDFRKSKVQEMANCERTLTYLKEVEKRKIELCEKEINDKFDGVSFVLWQMSASGELAPCCKPIIDDFVVGESTNTAREILAKLSIINGLSKFFEKHFPILIDGIEALDKANLKKIKTESQLILAKVSDKDLKIS